MTSIFKKIKSAFVIEEEHGAASSSEKVDSEQAKSTKEEYVPVSDDSISSVSSETDSTDGEINQKFTDILLRALEANNQEGFDYIEFKRSLQNLFKMNMEEGTVYKSAYATAQTLGATPKGLISSAQDYLTVLQREEDKFKVALNNQRAKQIEGGQEEVKRYEQAIDDKKKQIEKLQQEIDQHQSKLSEMKGEIETSAQKIESTRSDFVASYANLVNQIQYDIENIGKYLN